MAAETTTAAPWLSLETISISQFCVTNWRSSPNPGHQDSATLSNSLMPNLSNSLHESRNLFESLWVLNSQTMPLQYSFFKRKPTFHLNISWMIETTDGRANGLAMYYHKIKIGDLFVLNTNNSKICIKKIGFSRDIDWNLPHQLHMLFGLIFVPADGQGQSAQWLKTLYFSWLKQPKTFTCLSCSVFPKKWKS